MKTILITYDKKDANKDYEKLYNAIKTAKLWWHYLESVWIIVTEDTLSHWQEKLLTTMDKNDNLFLIEIKSGNVNGWLPEKAWDWIKKNTILK